MQTMHALQADTLLLGEAGGSNPNPDETLTEAEFLISVLKENAIVDDMTVSAIRKQFAHITRHDTWSSDPTNKVLDDRVVFLEMRAQGRIAQSGKGKPLKTTDGHKIEQVDLTAPDSGLSEWKTNFWLPRVYDGVQHGEQVRIAPSEAQTKTVVDEGGKKQFQRLPEPKPSTTNSTPTRSGAYFSDGAPMANGEYVWMPHEQARRHRTQNNDKDLGLWFLLSIFIVYFVWKILPTVIGVQFFGMDKSSAASSTLVTVSDDADASTRRLLADAGLEGLRVGEALTQDMLEEVTRLLRSR